MTRFIDVSTLSELVADVGVMEFMAGMSQTLRDDFMRWEDFDKSPRSAAHSDVGVIELMPVADTQQYAFKYVNGHPGNTALGMSTVMAFGALAEVRTGYPLLLSELTLTTALRTAATSAMAAKALARPDASVMALIGCGAQSEFQALAFHHQLGINTVRLFDVHRASMQKLARNLAPYKDLKVELMNSSRDAVRGAHIVTTATADKAWATILTGDMIEPGMHINGIGGDCPGKTELSAEVLRAGKIFVEYEPQTRVEGDIQQLDADHPVHDLWRVLTGEIHGRDSDEQITIFDSVGFALEDFSALRFLYDLAIERQVGQTIELVPELEDPKDLFRLTRGGRPSARVSRVA